jgi:NADH dehydrogenase
MSENRGVALVTGGAGVMGRRLCAGLRERGFPVRVLDRAGSALPGLDVDLRAGDITDPASLRGVFDGVQTVYHLAAVILPDDESLFESVNVEGTRNVLEAAAAAGAQHFIHVSSASVVYPHSTRYSRSKREGERLVRGQQAMQWTIVRPTLVYDENGGLEFMRFYAYLDRFPIVPFIGRGRARKRPVHTEDIMAGLIAIAGNPKTYGKVYALSGGEPISIWDLGKLMLEHRGRQRPFLPIPVPVCRLLARGLARVMRNPPLTWQMIAGITQDADLDPSDATADFGYRPMGVREGFQKTWPRPAQPAGGACRTGAAAPPAR